MYIIILTVDGTRTDVVGPFKTEMEADIYCQSNLELKLPDTKFHITDVTDPETFLKDINS